MNEIIESVRDIYPKIEAQRVKFQRVFLVGITVTAIIITLVLTKLSGGHSSIFVPVIVITLIISFILLRTINVKYVRTTRARFIRNIVKSSGLAYAPNGTFKMDAVRKHKLLPSYKRNRKEDGFKGIYNGVVLELQKVSLSSPKKKSGGLSSFQGIVIRIRLRRSLSGHTVILPKIFMQTIYDKQQYSQNVKLNNSSFEKKYSVISTDPVEAKVVLKSRTLDKLLDTGKAMKAKWVGASLIEDEIMIIIQCNRPMFKINDLWIPLTEEYLENTTQELSSILELIDELRNNPQIEL